MKKGIESLKEQVEAHKIKLREAVEKGDEELARYYEKDLARLENEEKKKKEQLNKESA